MKTYIWQTMRRSLEIIVSSFKMALQEFRANKLRTFLSLFGITVGIFCIISVLAIINSMETAVKDNLNSIAKETVFIGKWENGGGPDYPWWKYIKRPEVTVEEMQLVQKKLIYTSTICFFSSLSGSVEYSNYLVSNVNYYGVSEDFESLQSIVAVSGRNIERHEYEEGANIILIGYIVAETLFNNAENAVGKTIKLTKGKSAVIVGLLPKKGSSIFEAWDYDNSIIMPFQLLSQIIPLKNTNPSIMVQAGGKNIPLAELKEELQGVMRSVRRLSPGEENNFSLTDVDSFTKTLEPIIAGVNLGGWFIAGLSLIVGMFGVANIMFVTVKERTGQIGLKKAIGAKRSVILTEFLLESAFLCILGGVIGLVLVFILTKLVSAAIGFSVGISLSIFALAISICIVTGVLAGIIPAITAAKMNPVVAIRSK
ncbi:MAG: ABC transporter permease [Bacteroidota bacterium]